LLAQPTVGHLSHVEGSVTRLHRYASASARSTSGELRRDLAEAAFGREGGPGVARVGLVLLAGDEVHVGIGRAEITLTDGSAVQLDEHTRVALHAVDRVQVLGGRVFIRSSGSGPLIAESGGRRLHVMPGSDVEVTAANGHDLLVRVVEGDARIESSWGSEAVAATQSGFVSGPTGRPFVGPWVASPHDAFHQWAGGRTVVLVPPAAFLPYAHPTYRQQEYERVLRRQRFDRRRSGGVTRHDRAFEIERRDGDRPPETDRRGADRPTRTGRREREDERSGEQARRGHRREREPDTAPREATRPPAKSPATSTPRGATAGLVVRRP